jgi:lysozyme family protein
MKERPMEANFQRVLPLVLKHEGGFVNHPNDPGGATNKGITIATMRRYISKSATVDDLKRITDAQVATIYRKHYWDAVTGDGLPSGIDYAVFDFAVNSGPSRAAKYLQAVVGVAQDGAIGPATLLAARAMNPATVVARLCDDRMDFLKRLKHWPTFSKGWTRRVDDVRRHGLTLAAEQPVSARTPSPSVPLPPAPKPAPVATEGAPTGIWAFFKRIFGFGA